VKTEVKKAKQAAPEKVSRRKFLTTAAVGTAGAAAAGFPMISSAQSPINMRWQSTWPAKDIFHEFALDYAKKVNDMSGGELKIEVLPAGAVVPAFGLLDAVSKGTLDGGHGVLGYHYGKQNALAIWNTGPAFGMDANMVLAWHKYGGGKELLAKLYNSIGANVESFIYGPMPTQPLGWFKKPITKGEDFKGLKFRTNGLAIDMFTAMGAAVNALPGGEIVPAMDRGLQSSTTPPRTASSASPMSPRCACCKASTRAPKPSRSCSTRPSTMRYRPNSKP
jgi:TRAP-type mannitol/chloroaromatic compound transport system substrate-binding protein